MDFEYCDDRYFNYIPTGMYPPGYENLKPAIIYKSLPKNRIPFGHSFIPEFLNVNAPFVIEYWAKIPNEIKSKRCYISDDVYISTFGRIYNRRYKRFYKLCYSNKVGYVRVSGLNVQRAVLYTFNPIPNFYEMCVDHISCDPSENYLWNLRWVTTKQNNKYSIHVGMGKGITDFEADCVCKALITEKYTYGDISRALGVSMSSIVHTARGNSHRDISSKYNIDYNHCYSTGKYHHKEEPVIIPLKV